MGTGVSTCNLETGHGQNIIVEGLVYRRQSGTDLCHPALCKE